MCIHLKLLNQERLQWYNRFLGKTASVSSTITKVHHITVGNTNPVRIIILQKNLVENAKCIRQCIMFIGKTRSILNSVLVGVTLDSDGLHAM